MTDPDTVAKQRVADPETRVAGSGRRLCDAEAKLK